MDDFEYEPLYNCLWNAVYEWGNFLIIRGGINSMIFLLISIRIYSQALYLKYQIGIEMCKIHNETDEVDSLLSELCIIRTSLNKSLFKLSIYVVHLHDFSRLKTNILILYKFFVSNKQRSLIKKQSRLGDKIIRRASFQIIKI